MARSQEIARLVRIFRLAAGASLAPILVTSCGGISRSGFDQAVCTQTGRRPLVGVRFREAFDFVELRNSSAYAEPTYTPADTVGEACKGATNPTKCASDLAALDGGTGWVLPSSGDVRQEHYLVHTRGDEVGAVRSLEALDAIVAPVESVADAALIAEERGYHFDCEADPLGKAEGDAFLLIAKTGFACGEGTHEDEHLLRVEKDGKLFVVETNVLKTGSSNCAIGRRPEGFAKGRRSCRSPLANPVAAYLEIAAELEDASVVAFERLALELDAFAAPRRLVRDARRAARDEVRHTALMRRLATRAGGRPSPRGVGEARPRTLEEVAHENATEGCVRETFGALAATVQAARIQDAVVRSEFERIAKDETRHAALSWEVHGWFAKNLDAGARSRLEAAMREAITTLMVDLREDVAPSVREALGVLDPREAISLAKSLDQYLWQEPRGSAPVSRVPSSQRTSRV